jgi:hypothetical protein
LLAPGDTFLIPKSSNQIEHLWIVVTEPDPVTFEAVCVNVTTLQTVCDKTVILQPGDHPFIKHPSIVLFADAQTLDTRKIDAALNAGCITIVCRPHAPCNPALLKRIQQGVLTSKATPKGVKEYTRQKLQPKKPAQPQSA